MNVLVTGSNGRLGGKFIKHLINATDFSVTAVASDPKKIRMMMEREGISDNGRIAFLANEEFISQEWRRNDIDAEVHLAFSRRNQPAMQIASSIDFSLAVFRKLSAIGIKRVVNVSSQGVYGAVEEIRTVSTPPAPDNHYTMAKYAVEVLFDACFEHQQATERTNIRLDIVAQGNHLLGALCKQAMAGIIQLRGGEQVFSFIDEEDAATALLALLQSSKPWKRIYNVGWNHRRYTLLEIAEIVAKQAEIQGYGLPEIHLDRQDIHLWAGMDASLFMKDTNWKPAYELNDSIRKMLKTGGY